MWVGLMQSAEGLNRTKGWSPQKKRILPAFRLELKHELFLGLEPVSLRTRTAPSALLVLKPLDLDWNYTIGRSRSPACQQTCKTWDLPASIIAWANSLYKPLSVYMYMYLCISTHPISSVSRRTTTTTKAAKCPTISMAPLWRNTELGKNFGPSGRLEIKSCTF